MSNTLFIGKVYHRFDELGSTNDYALDLIAFSQEASRERQENAAKSKPPEGTVVRADSQSAGRGQFGSRWEAAPGQNLTFSVILYPGWLEVPAQFYLSMTVALACRDALQTLLKDCATPAISIKWPNDLYIGDRKVGGILIQNSISGGRLQSSVVGIGLNINQLVFSPEIPNPTSLALAAKRSFDLDETEQTLFYSLEQRYLQLKSGRRGALAQAYEAHLYRLGLRARYRLTGSDEPFWGILRGVREDGRLRLETDREELLLSIKTLIFEID